MSLNGTLDENLKENTDSNSGNTPLCYFVNYNLTVCNGYQRDVYMCPFVECNIILSLYPN